MLLLPATAKSRVDLRFFIFACNCRCSENFHFRLGLNPHHRRLALRCTPQRLESLHLDGDKISPQERAGCIPVSSAVDSRSGDGSGELLNPSARAVAAAIRRASSASPVEFVQRMDEEAIERSGGPSADFLRLCAEQMDLFRLVVDREARLSVYVRPAGSYVMDQIELHRITSYSQIGDADIADCPVLIGNFVVPAGLRAAEAHLSNQQVAFIPECGAIVLPMVKHPFVVGFIVAELPFLGRKSFQGPEDDEKYSSFSSSLRNAYDLQQSDRRIWEIGGFQTKIANYYRQFMADHSARAVIISRSLAMAYVMDQKAMLLQQSSWQNNIRMSHLVEQIRGPLSNMRTLAKMLSLLLKRSEVSHDIIEDILIQGDYMVDTLQQLQDAVYLTKANIVRYNEETLKKVYDSAYERPELVGSLLADYSLRELKGRTEKIDPKLAFSSRANDVEVPMPPLALAPQQENIRPSNVSDVLADLVRAAVPLAHQQKRFLKFSGDSNPLEVAVEESALRQALSNLIEGALLRTNIDGEVEIVATWAPAGGVLVTIDDDGPDMHYMTQMHSLTPFGADLFHDDMIEDNMTWNFVAGLTISREMLESYGCVVRVISPRVPNAALGTGGTRIELWLPTLASADMIDSSRGQLQA